MKTTTKEIVVRMLLERGDWMYGYELQGKGTKWGFSGVDADTRAHELARTGFFDSPNNRYYIEHRRKGKYAQFKASRSPLNAPRSLDSWTHDDFYQYGQEMIKQFQI